MKKKKLISICMILLSVILLNACKRNSEDGASHIYTDNSIEASAESLPESDIVESDSQEQMSVDNEKVDTELTTSSESKNESSNDKVYLGEVFLFEETDTENTNDQNTDNGSKEVQDSDGDSVEEHNDTLNNLVEVPGGEW